ncbi:hypothetical protein [Rubrivivax sp. JA1026]|uniref:hypothetical protein n=1 Tax=Rubrivivax sp. JA1026 TaxID=2710888 RepID=UPI0013E99264|nr:hypothetical protein [Rubrivivax sp. JA1026]
MEKQPRGRPKLPTEKSLSKPVMVRLSLELLHKYRELGGARWIREQIREAVLPTKK